MDKVAIERNIDTAYQKYFETGNDVWLQQARRYEAMLNK